MAEFLFWTIGGGVSVLFILLTLIVGPRLGHDLPELDNEFQEYHDDMEDVRKW